jgi:hypothetical protein
MRFPSLSRRSNLDFKQPYDGKTDLDCGPLLVV